MENNYLEIKKQLEENSVKSSIVKDKRIRKKIAKSLIIAATSVMLITTMSSCVNEFINGVNGKEYEQSTSVINYNVRWMGDYIKYKLDGTGANLEDYKKLGKINECDYYFVSKNLNENQFEEFLKAQGYSSLDEFLQKENESNLERWQEESLEQIYTQLCSDSEEDIYLQNEEVFNFIVLKSKEEAKELHEKNKQREAERLQKELQQKNNKGGKTK